MYPRKTARTAPIGERLGSCDFTGFGSTSAWSFGLRLTPGKAFPLRVFPWNVILPSAISLNV